MKRIPTPPTPSPDQGLEQDELSRRHQSHVESHQGGSGTDGPVETFLNENRGAVEAEEQWQPPELIE